MREEKMRHLREEILKILSARARRLEKAVASVSKEELEDAQIAVLEARIKLAELEP